VIDLPAYLDRIGLGATPRAAVTPALVHRAHATSIPFENLDPYRGVPVSLDPAAIEDKLVARRRGGYCFEHNLLLAAALTELGAEVQPLLARVRMTPAGAGVAPRPEGHLFLRVTVDGADWHHDVGFGGDTLLDPVPFGPGGEHVQAGWRYRVVAEPEGTLVLQLWRDGGWLDLYAAVPRPLEHVDLEVCNWYVSTNPRSPFVNALRVQGQRPGRRWFLNGSEELTLTEITPESLRSRIVAPAEVPALLAERFSLPGVLA
jgi:N-hydroxyarylamine O-acetyltransferase